MTTSIILAYAIAPVLASKARIRYTRNGAMRFLRIGRYQFSFVKCRNSI